MNKIKILYVDDEPFNLNAFLAHFRRNKNYKIHTCLSGEEGLQILNTNQIDIIIADQRMPNMTGVEFLSEAFKRNPEPMRIVVTAHRDNSTLEIALKEGKIFTYHDKPWDLEDLEKSIEGAYKVYQLQKKRNAN